METENTPTFNFRDRVLNMVKDREIKKTVVTFWQDHKEAIIVAGLCVFVGGVAYKLKPTDAPLTQADVNQKASLLSIGSRNTQLARVTNVTHMSLPTRFSNIVEDEFGNQWPSQAQAALENNESEANMSKHLTHGSPLKCGKTFTRVGFRL